MKSQKVAVLAFESHDENKRNITSALSPISNLITFENDAGLFQQAIGKNQYDVILIGMDTSNGSSFQLIEQAHSTTPYTPIIITGKDDCTDDIVAAIKNGATNFIPQPFSSPRLRLAVEKALEERRLKNEIAYLRGKQDIIYDLDAIIAESPTFKAVVKNLKKFALTDSTVLITGKTGTGKSFLSGSIHYNSPRKNSPFIKINCANIPGSLLESELFGHEKGAFTGADKQRIGRFEQANGGTIFLDEIGEIPLEIQAKLLRVIEEKSFERVGGNKTIHADVRIIAATNRDLPMQVAEGKFREDLYYRINVLPISLPTLRERSQCIEPLAKRLLAKAAISMKRTIHGFSPQAIKILKDYEWPGNIRQLANTIERAVILEERDHIQPESIQLPDTIDKNLSKTFNNGESLQLQEREAILYALENALWVQKNAAKRLGISPRALNYKIKKFGITHSNWRKNKKTD
ncbi:sigma-54-dependent transcriptional regulator [Desulfogranum japonicum]|uniref:sigma-54-dependent transcriptional regulator n=1 Tax=Desulfogranum japonicum TaxID=231447 RepID=UPI00040B23C2|nr:sigma-54 dependent transcriptional regulator [Desulfogranum japonicum]